MRKATLLLFLNLLIFSCTASNYKGQNIKSPTAKYQVYASVNRTNSNHENYAEVVIHLLNHDNKEISQLNSRAGDFSKWALGWTKRGDTIVLYSSDIGTQAWSINENALKSIPVNKNIIKRGELIKLNKYNIDE